MRDHRDIEPETAATAPASGGGRNIIVAIGIDRYRSWCPLANAVGDASGARALFQRLGFQEVVPPLLDEGATGVALRKLVSDDLKALRADDSLVLFYAGHGGAQTHDRGGKRIKTGYLIPIDAERDRVWTWIDLEGWLRSVSLLPPRHILVILDACHSGIALDPGIKWRDLGPSDSAPSAALHARCSRRVITSALDEELALDQGPAHRRRGARHPSRRSRPRSPRRSRPRRRGRPAPARCPAGRRRRSPHRRGYPKITRAMRRPGRG